MAAKRDKDDVKNKMKISVPVSVLNMESVEAGITRYISLHARIGPGAMWNALVPITVGAETTTFLNGNSFNFPEVTRMTADKIVLAARNLIEGPFADNDLARGRQGGGRRHHHSRRHAAVDRGRRVRHGHGHHGGGGRRYKKHSLLNWPLTF